MLGDGQHLKGKSPLLDLYRMSLKARPVLSILLSWLPEGGPQQFGGPLLAKLWRDGQNRGIGSVLNAAAQNLASE